MTTRRPLIAGNWKMFKTPPEAREFADRLKPLVLDLIEDVDIMVAPPFTALTVVAEAFGDSGVHLGAQNLFWEEEGAYTGEISAPMLKACGCDQVIIGHSERRQFFGETDDSVNRKVKAALAGALVPVVCIGESEAERDEEKTFSVIGAQVSEGLKNIEVSAFERMVVAYEPVWAIGTGKTATKEQAQEVHAFIRAEIAELAGNSVAKNLRILYGGSVKPNNIAGLISMEDIDGALVGGASLDPETFAEIIRLCSSASGSQE